MGISLPRRRDLRCNSTDAKDTLWAELRSRRLLGFKFRRQYPCGPYIVDFYCAERKLAIELDGGQHWSLEAQAYEARRSRFLRRQGIELLRLATDLVFTDGPDVMEEIARALGVGCPSP